MGDNEKTHGPHPIGFFFCPPDLYLVGRPWSSSPHFTMVRRPSRILFCIRNGRLPPSQFFFAWPLRSSKKNPAGGHPAAGDQPPRRPMWSRMESSAGARDRTLSCNTLLPHSTRPCPLAQIHAPKISSILSSRRFAAGWSLVDAGCGWCQNL